jgi:hypothetical protein
MEGVTGSIPVAPTIPLLKDQTFIFSRRSLGAERCTLFRRRSLRSVIAKAERCRGRIANTGVTGS